MGDKKSKVGEHFKKVGEGLATTKNKLKELSSEISGAKNVEGSTIKVIEDAIKGASDVFEQLIVATNKLADVSREAGDTNIGDSANATPGAADKAGVEVIIAEVKSIIGAAEKAGIKIDAGNAGGQVTAANATDAPAVLGGHNGNATEGAGPKLAAEVSKADPWAMIDKIKNAKASAPAAFAGNDNEVGVLAASNANAAAVNNGAKTNADLAAAVALKAMIKGGKFSAVQNDSEAIKAAAASAVNKVLGILDVIIRKTVISNLDKIREAIKGIKYSESSEIEANQSVVTK
ncbi:Variable large protein 10 (plasmid) [Borrelia crocidurae str. Achema]|uniref:Variable large protein n=1 Tax=Borrelia crocidurae (strain Achema) TaxID=1155096 RepID=I0FEW9_BORCA|nr:Variable large protein 10 [Borrelia crocidurae str. Achema]